VSSFNIEGQNVDGSGTTITARLADRQGNAVQDGTIVNFTTSGGQVASSCATAKIAGISQCSVVWQSQNPRPANGRVSVLAYAVGNKTFSDTNQNNSFDPGVDTLFDIGDPYRDDNENGIYDSNEFTIPLNGTGVCNGSGEPAPGVTHTCDGTLATYVRQQVIILNSPSSPEDIGQTLNIANPPGSFSFLLRSDSVNRLPMPVGTTVTASSITNTSTCKVNNVSVPAVGNISPGIVTNGSYPDLATAETVTLAGCIASDQILVKVTSPGGLVSSYIVTL
jgi:hypothetical protein